jgi:sulfoxide reductase heme-binding subunit YedZ
MLARAWERLTALLRAIIHWRFFYVAVWVACLAPGVMLGWEIYEGNLGAEPVKTLEHETGEFALGILFVTLAVTPFRRIFKINRIQIVRRMLGVWAFFYALAHLSIYLVFDQLCYSLQTCEFNAIWQDILKRKFIFVGQLAFVCLLLLAITSTNGWMRRLGRNWARLHKLVYVAAIAGVVHFIWIQKSDIEEPLNWAIWLAVLLGIRVFFAWWKRRPPSRSATASARQVGQIG